MGLYGQCLLFLFTGPWNIQISFIYMPTRTHVGLFCMHLQYSRSPTCDLGLKVIIPNVSKFISLDSLLDALFWMESNLQK